MSVRQAMLSLINRGEVRETARARYAPARLPAVMKTAAGVVVQAQGPLGAEEARRLAEDIRRAAQP
jgi:hypothetical protein